MHEEWWDDPDFKSEPELPRVLCWFSCGDASAVAAKLAIEKYGDRCEVLYCDTFAYEHPDNRRFFDDVQAWLGREIKILKSAEYVDIYDVFRRTRYLVGPTGARCTTELKKKVRKKYQRVDDIHVFGFTSEELSRIVRFRAENPELRADFTLFDAGITKADCHRAVRAAGIELPAMYRMGYRNNNCFTGVTRFLTDTGTRSLSSAVGQAVRVRGKGGGWKDATISSFGVQPIVSLTIHRPGVTKVIETTVGHRWFVRGKGNGAYQEKTTADLRVGDRLVQVFGRLGNRVRPSSFGVAQGIVFGDGTRGNTLNTAVVLVLCGEKKELLPYFPLSPRKEIATGIEVKDIPRVWKDLPSLKECQSFLLGWLSGYFATDGCVSDGSYTLSSAVRGNLEFAADVAVLLGIGVNGISTSWRTGYGETPTEIHNLSLIGATIPPRFFIREKHIQAFAATTSREPHPWQVVEVADTGRQEEVFCAVVPDGNAFTLEGNILTGNCIGCVKGGIGYWNKIRKDFPDIFDQMALMERYLDVSVNRIKVKGKKFRVFLDELPPNIGRYSEEPDIECGVLCMTEMTEK
jgi:hypothetical protein